MQIKLIVLAVSCAMLASCASAPQPVVPSGYEKKSINTEAAIDNYRARTAEEDANLRERTALARQVAALNSQLADMKVIMAVLAAKAEENGPKRLPAPQAQAEQTPVVVSPEAVMVQEPNQVKKTSDRESVEIRAQSLVFRMTHPINKTAFKPSDSLREALLQAARNCEHIEIRGRTDADKDSQADREIALDRALQARLYLVKNGIHPRKIRVQFMPYGGFFADNSTPEGKAKNRRVEVETMDLDTTDYRITAEKTLAKR